MPKTEHIPAVSIENIGKSFENKEVLKAVSFSVPKGQNCLICGPNAAGKSTLLRIIAGLTTPDTGQIFINNQNLSEDPNRLKPKISAVFHQPMTYSQLTVLENLKFFADLYSIKRPHEKIEELISMTHLKPWVYDKVAVLSRGLSQRLSIARALISKPEILLADEPFAGLDYKASAVLAEILSNFKESSGTVLMVSHDLDIASDLSSRVMVLENKSIILDKPFSQIDHTRFVADYLSYAGADK